VSAPAPDCEDHCSAKHGDGCCECGIFHGFLISLLMLKKKPEGSLRFISLGFRICCARWHAAVNPSLRRTARTRVLSASERGRLSRSDRLSISCKELSQ